MIDLPIEKISENPLFQFESYSLSDLDENVGFNYPIIVKFQDNQYIVFDGFKRFTQLKQQSQKKISALVLDEKFSDKWSQLILYLDINRRTHDIDDVYRSKVLGCLSYEQLDLNQKKILLQKLNLKNEYDAKTLLAFKNFPEVIKKYYQEHNYHLKWIKLWKIISSEYIEKVFEELKDYPLNQNLWAEVLKNLHELSRKESISFLETIEKIKKNILDPKDFKQFRSKLIEFLFPKLSDKQRQVEEYVKKCKGVGIKVDFSPFFEEESVYVNFKMDSPQEIDEKIKELKSVEWEEIHRIISSF